MSNLRPRTAMLLAIKLLVALSVLSYAVAMVLTTSDSTAFQPPISHFLGRSNGKNEDYLTLKVRRISHTWGRRGCNVRFRLLRFGAPCPGVFWAAHSPGPLCVA